jgi:hypothetical protein
MEFKFKAKRHVTTPILKIDDNGKPVYFKITGKIYPAPPNAGERTRKGTDGAEMAPPNLVDVMDYSDGQEKKIVVNTVLGEELKRTYPEDSYVGLSFEVAKFKPAGGSKRYATFTITEIEVEEPAKPVTPIAAPAKPAAAPAKPAAAAGRR